MALVPGAVDSPGLESCLQCWKSGAGGDGDPLALKAKGQGVRSREVRVLLHPFPWSMALQFFSQQLNESIQLLVTSKKLKKPKPNKETKTPTKINNRKNGCYLVNVKITLLFAAFCSYLALLFWAATGNTFPLVSLSGACVHCKPILALPDPRNTLRARRRCAGGASGAVPKPASSRLRGSVILQEGRNCLLPVRTLEEF